MLTCNIKGAGRDEAEIGCCFCDGRFLLQLGSLAKPTAKSCARRPLGPYALPLHTGIKSLKLLSNYSTS